MWDDIEKRLFTVSPFVAPDFSTCGYRTYSNISILLLKRQQGEVGRVGIQSMDAPLKAASSYAVLSIISVGRCRFNIVRPSHFIRETGGNMFEESSTFEKLAK